MHPKENTYHENFKAAIKHIMATEKLDSVKAIADYLGFGYMTLYKIMDGSNKPTVDHGIIICNKQGFSANWLFLDKGTMYYEEEITLNKIYKSINSINSRLKV